MRPLPYFLLHFGAFSYVTMCDEKELKILKLEKPFCPVIPFMLGNSSMLWDTYKHRTYIPYYEEDSDK